MLRPLSLLVFLPTLASAITQPLVRDPGAYLILGMQRANVFSLAVEAPGCNVGVNCTPLSGERGGCGFFHSKNGMFSAPGQVVANQVCGTRSFFEVCANLPACSDPTCSAISDPGSGAGCAQPFAGPILGDLNGDGQPSCDGNCMTDPNDVAAACGVTLPLPTCDQAQGVTVTRDEDCSIGDILPGNGRCDLDTGTYGEIQVRKGARIDFSPGTTVICGLTVRTAARVTSSGPATVLVTGAGSVRFNNSADVGSDCGMLRIVSERGLVKLGRYGDYNADICTIAGRLRLGHANNLRGHFVGDTITSDIGNEGRCCPTTSTTTTSTTSTSTSSTVSTSSTTSTTGPGTTSTSTTTTTPTTSPESLTSSTSTSTTSTTGGSGSTSTSTTTTTTNGNGSTTTTTNGNGSTTTTTNGNGSTTTTTNGNGSTTTTTNGNGSTTTTTNGNGSTTTTTNGNGSTTTTTNGNGSSTTSTSMAGSTTTSHPASTSTTSTTMPGSGLFTRTPGFYKTHPDITEAIISGVGGITVCGHRITNVNVNSAQSALEALCIAVHGDQRAQLLRQLLTAALTMAADGATYPDFSACDAVCRDPGASTGRLAGCIDETDAFNNSGDNVSSPWDPPGPAQSGACEAAFETACTVLTPTTCTLP